MPAFLPRPPKSTPALVPTPHHDPPTPAYITTVRQGYEGRFVRDYVDATVPQMAFGEYWDTCSYTDGVLNYNQDAHRQRTVDWCAGVLEGAGLLRSDTHTCGRIPSQQLPLTPARLPSCSQGATPPGRPRRPSTSRSRASCRRPSRGASTGALSTRVDGRPACWASGPPAPSPSWRTTTRGPRCSTGPSPGSTRRRGTPTC